MEFAYIVAGLAVGFVVGLTGIGGGALMTPILIQFFGISTVVAVSTDLLYAAITKFGGSITYARKKLVEYRIVACLLAGSVPASLLTLEFLKGLDQISDIEHLMNMTLGVSLVLTSFAVFFRGQIRNVVLKWKNHSAIGSLRRWRPVITVIMGAVLGCLVTLSSVGAGALGTAVLIVLYPHMSMKSVVGTDLLHAVVLTSVAGVGHYQIGNVDIELLIFLVIGSLPGVFIGSHLGARLSPKFMQ
ncbi:MAG: sulfite exporter TauE/SafE family protein, partial [Pontibacterium sp.]